MNCPICKTKALEINELESGLASYHCKSCEGNWMKSEHYWNWRNKQADNLSEKPAEESISLKIDDSKGWKYCPDCSRFMFGYKVGHETGFNLDRCSSCGGVWLDKNEWKVLKSRNLHDEIHFMFSAPWKNKIKREELEKRIDKLIKENLGEEDYLKVKEITGWVKEHSKKSEIMAYVNESVK